MKSTLAQRSIENWRCRRGRGRRCCCRCDCGCCGSLVAPVAAPGAGAGAVVHAVVVIVGADACKSTTPGNVTFLLALSCCVDIAQADCYSCRVLTKDWSEWAWEKKKTELAAERLRRQCREALSGSGLWNLEPIHVIRFISCPSVLESVAPALFNLLTRPTSRLLGFSASRRSAILVKWVYPAPLRHEQDALHLHTSLQTCMWFHLMIPLKEEERAAPSPPPCAAPPRGVPSPSEVRPGEGPSMDIGAWVNEACLQTCIHV